MTQGLPKASASEVIQVLEQVLEKVGFALIRQSRRHKIYKSSTGKMVTIPCRKGMVLDPKVVAGILDDAGLTREDLTKLLAK